MFSGPWSREAIKVLVSAGDVKVKDSLFLEED